MASNEFKLHLRAYAPFKSFGFGFEGDNRGPTSAPGATARIHTAVTFNPISGLVAKDKPWSSESTWLPLGVKATATPGLRVGVIKTGKVGIFIQLDVTGANPLLKGSPDIDFHLRFDAALSDSALNVSAGLLGDGFPNAEIFLEDHAGNRRMVQTFETTGDRQFGPNKLVGDRQLFLNGICDSFPVDKSGKFL